MSSTTSDHLLSIIKDVYSIVSFPQSFYWERCKHFCEIARQLWGGKKETNNSKKCIL